MQPTGRRRVLVLLVPFFFFRLMLQTAEADPITFSFVGLVTQTSFDPFDPFVGTIQFGTPLSGSYTFESTATDAIPDSSFGSYTSTGLFYGLQTLVGGHAFAVTGNLNIGVVDSAPGAGPDQYTVFAQSGTQGGLNEFLSLELFFQDPMGTALSSDALPLSIATLQRFPTGTFTLEALEHRDGTIFQYEIQGTIAPIPEPGTLSLLAAGLGGMGFWWSRLRRRRAAAAQGAVTASCQRLK